MYFLIAIALFVQTVCAGGVADTKYTKGQVDISSAPILANNYVNTESKASSSGYNDYSLSNARTQYAGYNYNGPIISTSYTNDYSVNSNPVYQYSRQRVNGAPLNVRLLNGIPTTRIYGSENFGRIQSTTYNNQPRHNGHAKVTFSISEPSNSQSFSEQKTNLNTRFENTYDYQRVNGAPVNVRFLSGVPSTRIYGSENFGNIQSSAYNTHPRHNGHSKVTFSIGEPSGLQSFSEHKIIKSTAYNAYPRHNGHSKVAFTIREPSNSQSFSEHKTNLNTRFENAHNSISELDLQRNIR